MFVLLLGGVFFATHTASAAIDQNLLNCAESSGFWGGAGCLNDVTVTTTAPTGCWFSNSDMQSGHGGGTYDIVKLWHDSCNTYYGAGNLNGEVLLIQNQDAGNENACVQTNPTYFEDNCTSVVPPPPATISISSCSVGGTWAFNPSGYTGQSETINVDPGGTLYSVTYTPPSGYSANVSPSSVMVYPGDHDTFNVNCPHIPPSSVTITAAPTSLQCGDSSTVSWVGTNVSSCTPSFSSSTAASGNQSVSPTATQTYSVSCVGNDGHTPSASVDVAVTGSCSPTNTQPSVTLIASPSTITAGQSTTLTWTSSNVAANSCSTYWTAQTGTSGSQSVSPVTTTPYSIVCHDSNNTPIYGSTQVNVSPTSATILVYSNIGGGGGTVNPGGWASGSGLTYEYVTPNPTNGTIYTLTPYSVNGYTFDHVEDGQNGSIGSSALLFPGGSKYFDVVYDQVQQQPPAPSDYTLSTSGSDQVMKSGIDEYGQNDIVVTAINSPNNTTRVTPTSIAHLPAGVDYSFSPSDGCIPNSTCGFSINLTVHPDAVVGSYAPTVYTSPLNHGVAFNLIISQGSAATVTCTPSPAVAKVGQPVVWTANASGGAPPYTYTWSGTDIPTAPHVPTSNPYSISYSTTGTKTAQVTATDINGQGGTCTAGTATVNINPTFQEF